MNKPEFLAQLRKGLVGLPQDDIEERLTFYSEMIEDRKEDGLSEEQAVLAAGTIPEIVAQAVSETPFAKIAKERIKPKRRLTVGEIVLLALGSPIWLSLGSAVLAVVFSMYISLWAVTISLWAVFVSFAACAAGGLLACGIFAVGGSVASGVAMLAVGVACAGLAIFMFFGCRAVTKGILMLTKKMAKWIKNCLIKKEEA